MTWRRRLAVLGIIATAVIATGLLGGAVGLDDLPGDTGETVDDAVSGAIDAASDVATGEEWSPPTFSPATEAGSVNETRLERLVHAEVNRVRRERGLNSLDFDRKLATIARYHSSDMARNDYFAHTAPDDESMQDRYDRFGYDCRVPVGNVQYRTGGENIAMTRWGSPAGLVDRTERELAETVVEGWMNSPSHRENMLTPEWRREGIGAATVTVDGEVRVYVTQNFC